MSEETSFGDWRNAKNSGRRAHQSKIYHGKRDFKPKNAPIESPSNAIQGIIEDSSKKVFRKRTVSSNWSQYEDTEYEEDQIENEQLNAADFERLLQSSISSGNHFFFDSEKSWADEEDFNKTIKNGFFQLNVALLSAGLQTIPFYKRLDYDSSMFNSKEIQKMNREAELSEKVYKDELQKFDSKTINLQSRKSSARSVVKQEVKPLENLEKNLENNKLDGNDDELDELLSLTTKNVAKVDLADDTVIAEVSGNKTDSNQKSDNGNKEDIQQWLDDILDE